MSLPDGKGGVRTPRDRKDDTRLDSFLILSVVYGEIRFFKEVPYTYIDHKFFYPTTSV